MRFVLLLLLFSTGTIFSQNSNSSPKFLRLAQVEQAPVYPGCDTPDLTECSPERITSYFTENIDEALAATLTPEESVVILRFVVDTEGNVRNPNVQSNSEELKLAGIKILQSLPQFKPGVHEGEIVNVIMDIPLKIEKTSGPIPLNSNLLDSPPMAVNCVKSENPRKCTSQTVQEFIHKNFRDQNLQTGGKLVKAVIKFTIDEEGKVTDVIAEGDLEDKEALNLIKKLPEFIPGTKDGNNIAVEIRIPIMFQTK